MALNHAVGPAMTFDGTVARVGKVIDAVGVATIVAGVVVAVTLAAIQSGRKSHYV